MCRQRGESRRGGGRQGRTCHLLWGSLGTVWFRGHTQQWAGREGGRQFRIGEKWGVGEDKSGVCYGRIDRGKGELVRDEGGTMGNKTSTCFFTYADFFRLFSSPYLQIYSPHINSHTLNTKHTHAQTVHNSRHCTPSRYKAAMLGLIWHGIWQITQLWYGRHTSSLTYV